MQQDLNEEQEKEILKLREQMEEGRKSEEILNKQCMEKEVLDDILSSQRSPTIKIGLGFHESVEGESSSQGEARNSKEKSKMINKERRGQPHQQSRKEILQRKSFTPSYGSNSRPFTQMNNIECYEFHNLGHVAAR